MRFRDHQAGFSLIEILVVLVIIGTVISVGVLSLNLASDDRDLVREARRFMSLVEVAQDEAMVQGREFGIEFMNAGYRFVEYDSVAALWTLVPNDDKLIMRQLPADVVFELWIEEKRILLDDNPKMIMDEDDDAATTQLEAYLPHVFVFSSGDMTPFEITMRRVTDQLYIDLAGDLLGNVELVTDDVSAR